MWRFVNALRRLTAQQKQHVPQKSWDFANGPAARWRNGNVRRWLLALAITSWCAASHAGEWAFRRSYFSHGDRPGFGAHDVVRSQGAYRDAIMGGHPRFAIRGGWRYNNIIMQNGTSTDRTFIREHWFDVNY